MLKIFRKKIVSKIILWGLLILILPAFVMWGSASMSRSKEKGPSFVGMINGKKASFDDLRDALAGVRSQIILNYFNQPKVLDTLLGNKSLLAKLAWDRLLMLAELKRMHIKVPDKEVINYIKTHPLFVRNGAFDDRFYSYVLRNNIGLEPRAFEESIRENIALRKINSALTRDVKVSDEEAAQEYKKEFQKYKISYVLVDPKNFLNEVKVGEKEIEDFYYKHKSDMIVKSNLKGLVPDRQGTLEESKPAIEKYLQELEVRKTFKERAENIYKKIQDRITAKNETFGKAAAAAGFEVKNTDFFSKDTDTEDLGNMLPIVDAASGLKELELSKPVEISKGYVIFEIIAKKPADEEEFKKNKDVYSKKVLEEKSNVIMGKWLNGLETKADLKIKLEDIDKYYK